MIDLAVRLLASFGCSVAWLWFACAVAQIPVEVALRDATTKRVVLGWAATVILGASAVLAFLLVEVWGAL